jgi:16S rRNA (guanine966-N2)-methyltransferase
LGLEALSRGANEVVFVEHHPAAVSSLRENLQRLGATTAHIDQSDALVWLHQSPTPFDIVLLDPPFGQNYLAPVCAILEQAGWLAATAWIYLEAETTLHALALPTPWTLHRQKTAGVVAYRLLRRDHSKSVALSTTYSNP